MKIIALGCGNIGSVVAIDLAESLPSAEIVVADISESRAAKAASSIGKNNVSWIRTDASNHRELVSTLKKFDLVIGALPGEMGYKVCKAAIAANVDIVDVSYMPEDVMALHKDASRAGISILPDCGMSPGLGNILVGHAVSKLGKVDSVHILNGGLPEKPVPPLGYIITWSLKDLIDMYSRKVTIVSNGKRLQVEAMTGLEEIDFPDVGKLEAFYTDGPRTMLHTIKNVKDMWEKSLRYPGHAERINLLRQLGFFDNRPLQIEDVAVSPRKVTERLLEKSLKMPKVPDIVAMRVDVSGERSGKRLTYTYYMLDRYDKEHQVTAMARTTGYTTSAVAQLVAHRDIEEKGVIPPEKLGMNEKLYNKVMRMMKKRGIIVKESKKSR